MNAEERKVFMELAKGKSIKEIHKDTKIPYRKVTSIINKYDIKLMSGKFPAPLMHLRGKILLNAIENGKEEVII